MREINQKDLDQVVGGGLQTTVKTEPVPEPEPGQLKDRLQVTRD